MTIFNSYDYHSNVDYYDSLKDEHNFQILDSLRMDRLYSPRFHPINGRSIIYLRRQYHMQDLRKSTTSLNWLELETNKTVQLTRPIWGKHDRQFYWIKSDTILFLSNRASSKINQIFQLKLPNDLSKMKTKFIKPIQITHYPLSVQDLLVNRQGTRLAFGCKVYPNLTIEQTYARYKKENDNNHSFYEFNKLSIRYWDHYLTGPRYHPFVVSIKQKSDGTYKFSSEPVDLLFGIDSSSPERSVDDAGMHWSFSASGNSFTYVRRRDETSALVWTTNYDIYTVDLNEPEHESVCITCDNLGIDQNPSYSPTDDEILIYLSISKSYDGPDQVKIEWYNVSNSQRITILDHLDKTIFYVTWSPTGRSFFLEIGKEARKVIYRVDNLFNETLLVRLTHNGTSQNINVHPINDQIFVFTHESLLKPTNIYLHSLNRSIRPLTEHNQALLSKVKMCTTIERFSFIGARNDTVWGWYIAPIDSAPTPVPVLFYIHGGPQTSYYDGWDYYWNLQTYASQGYAIIVIDFHGSESYGQNFTDSILGEFGSLPYEDLNLGLTYALKQYPNIDPDRVVAYGASYGGYMVYWIAGQPKMSHRFKTLISHNGIFDLRAFAYSVDEVVFMNYYFGINAPWSNPDVYERFNPVNRVANWSQPMLIIVGANDYRVPETQGISAFTALQLH
ncbi:unnamed protein product, partial [Rotaria sordida]